VPGGIRAVSSSRPAHDAVPPPLVRACCSLVVGLDIFASPAVPAARHHRPSRHFSPMIPIATLLPRCVPAASPSAAALVFSLIFTSSPATFVAAHHHARARPRDRLHADAHRSRPHRKACVPYSYYSTARGSMPQGGGVAQMERKNTDSWDQSAASSFNSVVIMSLTARQRDRMSFTINTVWCFIGI
jgi:hypothetical protein